MFVSFQVHVRVRGHLSSCGAVSMPTTSRPETCKFLYSFRNTPNVTFVDPGMVRRGDDVTIIGEGFGDSLELVDVHLGDTLCNITFLNDTLIICTVQSSSSGPKRVQVLVSPVGRAAIPDLSIDYNVTVDGINPSDVGLGGGNTVKISGSGFLDDECRKMSTSCECSDVSVLIGGMKATVVSSSETEIVCTTPPSSTRAEETVSVTVLISCDDGSVYSDSLVDGISYQNNSAVITSIEPVEGTAGGGTVVNIAGQNLPTNSDDVTVMVSECIYVYMYVCVCNPPVHSYVYVLMPSTLLCTLHDCITAMLSTLYCTWVVRSHVVSRVLYRSVRIMAMSSTVCCTWVFCSHVYCVLYVCGWFAVMLSTTYVVYMGGLQSRYLLLRVFYCTHCSI